MAGTFGLKAENYRTSLEAGRPMLAELGKARGGFRFHRCSTCRMQMEDGTGKRTLHPGAVPGSGLWTSPLDCSTSLPNR